MNKNDNENRIFYSIRRGKMGQILLAYGLPIETRTAIMMLGRNTKVKVRSLNKDMYFFDIVAGVLQDSLALILLISYPDCVVRISFDLIKK